MAYQVARRTLRLDAGAVGEPDAWIEVEHPEALTWRTKVRLLRAGQAEGDEIARATGQACALVVGWSLTDFETGEALPLPATAEGLERAPAQVVEHLLTALGEAFTVPKASGSA